MHLWGGTARTARPLVQGARHRVHVSRVIRHFLSRPPPLALAVPLLSGSVRESAGSPLLVAGVSPAQGLKPREPPAFLAAVMLMAVAGPTDDKRLAATPAPPFSQDPRRVHRASRQARLRQLTVRSSLPSKSLGSHDLMAPRPPLTVGVCSPSPWSVPPRPRGCSSDRPERGRPRRRRDGTAEGMDRREEPLYSTSRPQFRVLM